VNPSSVFLLHNYPLSLRQDSDVDLLGDYLVMSGVKGIMKWSARGKWGCPRMASLLFFSIFFSCGYGLGLEKEWSFLFCPHRLGMSCWAFLSQRDCYFGMATFFFFFLGFIHIFSEAPGKSFLLACIHGKLDQEYYQGEGQVSKGSNEAKIELLSRGNNIWGGVGRLGLYWVYPFVLLFQHTLHIPHSVPTVTLRERRDGKGTMSS